MTHLTLQHLLQHYCTVYSVFKTRIKVKSPDQSTDIKLTRQQDQDSTQNIDSWCFCVIVVGPKQHVVNE